MSSIAKDISRSPARHQIRQIVEAAIHAPSGDNCQPWNFHWTGSTLQIFHNYVRAEHELNRGYYASVVTLGCVLELITLEASHLGFEVSFTLPQNVNPTPGKDSKLWAEVLFAPGEKLSDPLREMTRERHTNRNAFRKDPLPENLLKEVEVETKRFSLVSFYQTKVLPKSILRFIVRNEMLALYTEKIRKQILHTIDFKSVRLDKMPWTAIAFPVLCKPIFMSWRSNKWFSFWKSTGGLLLAEQMLRDKLKAGGGYLLLTVDNTKPETLVQAGRLFYRIWAKLNQEGYAVQPHNMATLYPLSQDNFERSPLAEHFNLKKTEIPLLFIRTGRAKPVSLNKRAQRMRIDELFTHSP